MRSRALTTLLVLLLLLTGAGYAAPCTLCASAAHAAASDATMPACNMKAALGVQTAGLISKGLRADCCTHAGCAKGVQPQTASAIIASPEAPPTATVAITTLPQTENSQLNRHDQRVKSPPPLGGLAARPKVLRV